MKRAKYAWWREVPLDKGDLHATMVLIKANLILLAMHDLIPTGETCNEPRILSDGSSTIKQALEANKRRLEERLAKVNAGLAVLNNDPKLAEALETLTKATRA